MPNRVCCAPVEITPLDEKGIERVKLLFDWPRRILDILIVQVFCVLKNEEEEEGRKGKNDEGMIKQTTNSFLMAKKQNYSTVIAVYLWMKKDMCIHIYIHTHTHTRAIRSTNVGHLLRE